jgi:hypothetical protein
MKGTGPMARSRYCPSSSKYRFRDHSEAIQALHRAQNARHWAEADGTTTRRSEVRAYRCRDCNGWHLTSQGKRTAQRDAVPMDQPPAMTSRSDRAQTRGALPAQLIGSLRGAVERRHHTGQASQRVVGSVAR